MTPTASDQTAILPAEQADPAPSPRGVYPHHLKELRASGLSNETIEAAGIYSESQHPKLANLLNRKKWPKAYGAAMVFPFRDEAGTVVLSRVKPDNPPKQNGKPSAKYLSPTGQRIRAYIPASVWAIADDATKRVFIPEGEKKALGGTQEGFPAIGLTGVDCWHLRKSNALIADLARFEWKDRKVYIVFDSDAVDNPQIQENESLLAAALTNHGATVKIVRLPGGPDGEKVGLDDFLVANDVDEFHKLVNEATDPKRPDPGGLLQDGSDLDPASEAGSFFHTLMRNPKDKVFPFRFWRGSFFLWRNGAYHELHPAEVKAKLIRYLNRRFRKLGGSKINDTQDQLRAQSLLSFSVESPAWLGEPVRPWAPNEILATKNHLVHLPSLVNQAEEHSIPSTPRFFTQAALDYEFNANAPKPEAWISFLHDLWAEDTESIRMLREWFGYCLIPDTSQQKILMLIGPTRSGKGVLARVLRGLIGQANVAGPTLASLGTNFGIWPLLGKSLSVISDARMGGRTDAAVVLERLLSISGEDALTIDRKNLEPVTSKLSTRILILSNELPRFADASGAIAGRMILLRLVKSWFGKENPSLSGRLLKELPGILLWAVGGWKSLHDRGHFIQPTSANELAGELRDLASPIGRFIREKCEVGPECEVERKSLFIAYQAWATADGRRRVEDVAGFGRVLRAAIPELGDVQHRVNGRPERFYLGVGLLPDPSFGE